jgi:hypothetical protein
VFKRHVAVLAFLKSFNCNWTWKIICFHWTYKSHNLFRETLVWRVYSWNGPPQLSSSQKSWLQIHRSRVRFPALQDFLSRRSSGTGSTQPHENKWGATWKKSSSFGLENQRLKTVGDPRRWIHDTPLSAKGGTKIRRPAAFSVGIVRSLTKIHGFSYFYVWGMRNRGVRTEFWRNSSWS